MYPPLETEYIQPRRRIQAGVSGRGHLQRMRLNPADRLWMDHLISIEILVVNSVSRPSIKCNLQPMRDKLGAVGGYKFLRRSYLDRVVNTYTSARLFFLDGIHKAWIELIKKLTWQSIFMRTGRGEISDFFG
jgi:hypothetical protein